MQHNLCCVFVGAAVIEGPSEVIYRPGGDPIELSCNITEGIIGWRLNDGQTFSVGDIRDRKILPGHMVNGTNLVIVKATNNTEYICVSTTSDGDTPSAPVYLYIAGMLIISPHHIVVFTCTYTFMYII